ncbi:NAD-dependent epimerase/dehydratase family protein [Phycisphaerales bacterium AB-hyl4]|uniref:NAD-dependent epimerase/dehydratase family protein n=1 Tax=Natronomicrosphaera hydrolytica TaxID=3242702 RepID=A0ABV4U084_9BACT
MAHAFVTETEPRVQPADKRRRVLVTGAAGRIGSYFAEHSHARYDLTLIDQPGTDLATLASYGRTAEADIGNLEQLKQHFQGIDTVVHLAAGPSPSEVWETVLKTNIVGTYNVFVAAKAADCRRVVFASSIHAVSAYPVDVQVKPDDPVNPGDLYGVSKCFGEAMARFMATQHGLSAIAIRIGGFQPLESARDPDKIGMMNAFVSRRDLNQLIQCCIDNESLRFAIAHGLSKNVFNQMDISETREMLGYEPQDDFSEENPRLQSLHLRENVQPHSEQGHDQPSGIREQL